MKKTILFLMMGCAAFAYACSSDDTSNTDAGGDDSGTQDSSVQDSSVQDSSTQDSGGDSSAQDSGGDSSAQDSGGDAGPVNGCTTFTDFTTAGGTIVGPTGNGPQQYVPNCVHIKTGQMVTWTSKFSAHPLEPSGGTTPSPITLTNSGTTVSFTFPNVGVYGFDCMNHPGSMFGAVEVTQ